MAVIDTQTRTRALRGLVYGLLLGWLAKWDQSVLSAVIYRIRPLDVGFFPWPLQSWALLVAAFCAPLVVAFAALLLPAVRPLGAALLSFALGSALLLLHQDSYNDATFVTSLWTSLIGLWLYRASAQPDPELPQRAGFLTQLLIGLLFLGGVVGKLTPGYVDGSVLYGLYFEHGRHFTFELLRNALDPSQLRTAARVYTWLVLAVESLLATLPLWPTRPALTVALFALAALVMLNNLRLASVMLPVMSLAAVALWLLWRNSASARTRA